MGLAQSPDQRIGCVGEQEAPPGHDDEVTRDRFDAMAMHCADLDIEIAWSDLGEFRRGYCQVGSDRIVLNSRLSLAQATSVLAHEVGHWTFGDTTSTPSAERRAWEYGASLIIEPREYAAAEALVGPSVGALAAELGVTTRIIEGWRRWWMRQGCARATAAAPPR